MSQTHEDFEEHIVLRSASDRTFGLAVGGIAAVIGLVRLVLHWPVVGPVAVGLMVAGVLLMAFGQLAPHLLAPLNRAWTKLGLVMFKVVSPVVLFLLYACVFCTVGWFMRLRKYDPMHRARDAAAPSYWIPREPPGPPPEGMVNQF